MRNVEICRFEAGHFDRVRALYQSLYPGRERHIGFDRMRLTSTTDGLTEAQVAIDGDRLVAFYGIWPLNLFDGRRVVRGGQSIDTMTHPDFQGQGLFSELARRCYLGCSDRGMEVLYGLPNANSAPGFTKRLSWAAPDRVGQFVRPISGRGVGQLRGAALSTANAVLPLGGKDAAPELEQPENDLIEELLTRTQDTDHWSINQTAEWYDFRFQDDGRGPYEWLSLYDHSDRKLDAFAVWRKPTTPGESRGFVLALVGDQPKVASLVRTMIQRARIRDVSYLTAFTTAGWRSDILRRAAFVRIRHYPLIVRAVSGHSHRNNPFNSSIWSLFGADYDFN